MNEDNLKQLLKQTDEDAELFPLDAGHLSSVVRRRLNRRKQTLRYGLLTAVALITVFCLLSERQYQSWKRQRHIAQLEQEVEELTRRTEETLALVQDMYARQQQEPERQSDLYWDPIQAEVDEAANILVYQADRMAEKYNRKDTAIENYNQVIECFGDTPSAETARERLKQIQQKNQPNRI